MAILLKKLSFDTATQTRNTERAFPFREGSFAAQASFFNDMFWPKLFEKNKNTPCLTDSGLSCLVRQKETASMIVLLK